MADISHIGQGSVGPLNRLSNNPIHDVAAKRKAAAATDQPARRDDRVELSDHARYVGLAKQSDGVRHEVVDRVRDSIEKGDYETPHRLQVAIDGLLEDLLDD